MPSALLPSCSSGIPPGATRTLTGRGSNRPSLRATPSCVTSLVAGHHFYQRTFCRAFLCTSAPPSRRFRSLLAKASYTPPTTASSCSFVNRLRKPPSDSQRPVGRAACLLSDEPVRIYVPLLMRPWGMQACQSTASCHLGTTRTLRMLERAHWWNGMSICTRWWLRHCLKCQARKTSRLTVRWPHDFNAPA